MEKADKWPLSWTSFVNVQECYKSPVRTAAAPHRLLGNVVSNINRETIKACNVKNKTADYKRQKTKEL